jgi:hypothetical protein
MKSKLLSLKETLAHEKKQKLNGSHVPCPECENPDARWHGDEHGSREYMCNECFEKKNNNEREYGEEPIDELAFTVEENPMPESRFAESKRIKRKNQLKEGEMFGATGMFGKIRDAYLTKYPSGRFGFAGRVPAQLMYKRNDGVPISDEDIEKIKRFGPGLFKHIQSVAFETPYDAIEASRPYNILIRGYDDDIVYDPSTGEINDSAIDRISEHFHGRKLNESDDDGKNGYIAFYKGKRMEIYADTKLEARDKAAKAFRAKKAYDVNVELAELDGEEYIHTATESKQFRGRNLNKGRDIQFRSLNEMWSGPLQNEYSDFEEFERYDEMYNLSHRLGFDSAQEAWDANPNVKGSTDPNEYGRANESDMDESCDDMQECGGIAMENQNRRGRKLNEESWIVSRCPNCGEDSDKLEEWDICPACAEEQAQGLPARNYIDKDYIPRKLDKDGINEAMEIGKEDSIDDKISNATISELARMIRMDWKKVYFGASPYLGAMNSMNSVDDSYGMDDGRMVINYFLANASQWKGELARKIKKELNKRVKSKPRRNESINNRGRTLNEEIKVGEFYHPNMSVLKKELIPQQLKILKAMLQRNGENKLLVKKIETWKDGTEWAYVSGWEADAFLGTLRVPKNGLKESANVRGRTLNEGMYDEYDPSLADDIEDMEANYSNEDYLDDDVDPNDEDWKADFVDDFIDDEDDDEYVDENKTPEEPEEEDWIINDDEGTVYEGGKPLFHFKFSDDYDWDDLFEEIRENMEEQKWYPNVWTCSDHGNWNLQNVWEGHTDSDSDVNESYDQMADEKPIKTPGCMLNERANITKGDTEMEQTDLRERLVARLEKAAERRKLLRESLENDIIDDEYFDYVVETYLNGQFTQLKRQFAEIREQKQSGAFRSFLRNVRPCSEEVCNRIIDKFMDYLDESSNRLGNILDETKNKGLQTHIQNKSELVKTFAGQPYHTAEDIFRKYNWSETFPEIDEDGLLTGYLVDGYSSDHIIVDVDENGNISYDSSCSDAMIEKDVAIQMGLIKDSDVDESFDRMTDETSDDDEDDYDYDPVRDTESSHREKLDKYIRSNRQFGFGESKKRNGRRLDEGKYQVIVGNIGTVYDDDDDQEALSIYIEYVKMSKDGYGRAGGEDVTLFEFGEPIEEHFGDIEDSDVDESFDRMTDETSDDDEDDYDYDYDPVRDIESSHREKLDKYIRSNRQFGFGESKKRNGRKLNENHTGAVLRSGVPVIGGADFRSTSAKHRKAEPSDEIFGSVYDQYGGIRLTNDDIFAENSYERNMGDYAGGIFDDDDFVIDMNRLRKPKSITSKSNRGTLTEKFREARNEEQTMDEQFDEEMGMYYIDGYDSEDKGLLIEGPGDHTEFDADEFEQFGDGVERVRGHIAHSNRMQKKSPVRKLRPEKERSGKFKHRDFQ